MKRIASFMTVAVLAGLLAFAPLTAFAKEGAKEGDAAPPEFEYVELEPLNLPIITTKGLTQQVSLIVSLEIDYGKKDTYMPYKPRLADAFLQDLYGSLGAGHGLMAGNVIDVQKIKERLTNVTDKVLGPDRKVRNVLLQAVQQHPLN